MYGQSERFPEIRSSHGVCGGTTSGCGFHIDWQVGPIPEGGRANGAFVEDIIKAAIDRIEFYQKTRFACGRNKSTLRHLCLALESQEARMQDQAEVKEAIRTLDKHALDGAVGYDAVMANAR